MWHILYDCMVKEQAFTYSCYPCSLHIGLVNLDYMKAYLNKEDDSVEIFFNEACKIENNGISLDVQGPLSVGQLFRITNSYLQWKNIHLRDFNFFYTDNGKITINTQQLLKWNKRDSYVAIISSYTYAGHATIIVKNQNTYTHIYTSSERNVIEISSEYGNDVEIIAPNRNTEYSQIQFYGNNKIDNRYGLIKGGDVLFIFN